MSESNIQINLDQDKNMNEFNGKSFKDTQIDSSQDKFPYCLVWTPLPLIT